MNKYHPDNACPKCRCGAVVAQYHTGEGQQACHEKCITKETEPHVHRFCQRCSYDWAELPVDYVAPPRTEIPQAFLTEDDGGSAPQS